MPRKKSGSGDVKPERGAKSAAIREMLEQDPHAKVRDIVATLAGRGLQVGPNMVYFVKSEMKRKNRRRKRLAAEEAGKSAGLTNPVDLVRMVKDLATAAGGLKKLKQLVDILAE